MKVRNDVEFVCRLRFLVLKNGHSTAVAVLSSTSTLIRHLVPVQETLNPESAYYVSHVEEPTDSYLEKTNSAVFSDGLPVTGFASATAVRNNYNDLNVPQSPLTQPNFIESDEISDSDTYYAAPDGVFLSLRDLGKQKVLKVL
jgi:hypothetical protein